MATDVGPEMTRARSDRRPERRVAIIGGGMIAQVHRRAALLAGAQVVGVLGRNAAESTVIATNWGVERAFTDLDQLLNEDVDVVHVCTPNATHPSYALAVLEAGKNVICEKPIALDTETAEKMAAAARAAAMDGRIAAVPFVYRYHPVVREIRARRLAGELGEIFAIHGSYLQDWMLPPDVGSWRLDPACSGRSRAFGDIGSHWFDLVEWISGERIGRITAQTSIAIAERAAGSEPTFAAGSASGSQQPAAPRAPVTTEDIAMVLGRTVSGVPVAATISQVAAGRKNRLWFELDGSEHSAVFDQENPESAWFGALGSNEVFVRGPGVGSPEQRRLSQLPAGHPQGYAQCFEAFVADAYAASDGAQVDGLPSFEDGLRAARITDAVLQSAAADRWVGVES